MEKVVAADKHSAVAISGAAGPAMEMIKLFQVQLEHFEKMEGRPLSLEGKANQLSMMLRGNLPAAMQGMVVIPLFAGYDMVEKRGRLWDFDVTGGRYEEREHVAIGSGGMLAGTVVKVGWKASLSETEGVELACRSLWQAAEGDSATGGHDALRGVYPIVMVIDASGVRRLDDTILAGVFARIEQEAGSR
jgi:proteasome beta subunit